MIGCSGSAMRKNSRSPRTPSTIIAAAKTAPPAPTIAIAKITQGIATTTRAVVSDICGTRRRRRFGSSSLAAPLLESTDVSGSSGSLDRGGSSHRYLAPKRRPRSS